MRTRPDADQPTVAESRAVRALRVLKLLLTVLVLALTLWQGLAGGPV